MQPSETWYVPHQDISPDPFNPRTSIDQTKLRELAQSIVTYGLIQPIVVRPTTDDDAREGVATPYVIVAGERRWLACEVAGIEEVACTLLPEVTVGDKRTKASTAERNSLAVDLVGELALVENIQRADLSPTEEARAFKRILDNDPSANQTILASRLGLTVDYVRKRLLLLTLPDSVLDHIHAQRLTIQQGMCLQALTEKTEASQIIQIADLAALRKWPLAKVEKAVAAALGQEPRARYSGKPKQAEPEAPPSGGDPWKHVCLPPLGDKKAKLATVVTSDGVVGVVVAYRGTAQEIDLIKASIRATVQSFAAKGVPSDDV